MTGGPEWTDVEEPFIDQLASMGWKLVIGNLDEPSVTGRKRVGMLIDGDHGTIRKASHE